MYNEKNPKCWAINSGSNCYCIKLFVFTEKVKAVPPGGCGLAPDFTCVLGGGI